MGVKVNELKPYKSLILAKLPDAWKVRSCVNAILADMKEKKWKQVERSQ